MSLPYFPFYVDDYEADTAHLTLEEDGAYVRLLRLCWRSPGCSIPADEKWITRKMRATPAKFKNVIRPVLEEFFDMKAGRFYSSAIYRWVDRHRKKSPRPWIPLDVQREVRSRDGKCCAYCGTTHGPFHLDHKEPWSLGGEHTVNNLVVACAGCNWAKGAMPFSEWEARLV